MDHRHAQPLADPISDRANLDLQEVADSCAPRAPAAAPDVCAELDHYHIAVVVRAVYERDGYRHTNASDAIAAAKRAAT